MFGSDFGKALALALCLLATTHAFIIHNPLVAVSSRSHSSLQMKWDGKSPPKANATTDNTGKADASWDRAGDRAPVWEDLPNPTNKWWEAYAPSEEEIEAAEQGYNWNDPEAWFEAKRKEETETKTAAK